MNGAFVDCLERTVDKTVEQNQATPGQGAVSQASPKALQIMNGIMEQRDDKKDGIVIGEFRGVVIY